MGQTNPHNFSYADLDRMSGQVLPRRLLLSAAGQAGHLDAVYACQYTHTAGTDGVLGTGVMAEPERTTVVCFPVVVDGHS